ncbi:hypothetical protein [Plantactinospora sp. BC1]|nr:hypothetical protein [Plantactinospora sp. BC1]
MHGIEPPEPLREQALVFLGFVPIAVNLAPLARRPGSPARPAEEARV